MSDTDNKKKKWTLMFYFASDNTLSPSMLYQFKAIKTAGYQVDTNVLVHFDPHERGIPSMIFEVNRTEKEGKRKSQIGDDRDPRVRDLAGDQFLRRPHRLPGRAPVQAALGHPDYQRSGLARRRR